METTAPKFKRRRFHFVPEHFVVGTLVGIVLLWLSERFQWVGFNCHKGWTVLVAVAFVGAAFLIMLEFAIVMLLCRWRFQFGIRTLLILVVVVALPCSWMTSELRNAKAQATSVQLILNRGGTVIFTHDNGCYRIPAPTPIPQGGFNNCVVTRFTEINRGGPAPQPTWLRGLLGRHFFDSVTEVYLLEPVVKDNDLDAIGRLTALSVLWLDFTGISDQGIERLRDLVNLQELALERTALTDGGMEAISTFKGLKGPLTNLWVQSPR